MSKIKWGKLSEYFPTELLDKTNVDEFITQEIVDEFNEVLVGKNPNHKEGDFREWDYAEFLTKNGYFFSSYYILKPLFASTDFDELQTTLHFAKDNKSCYLKGVNYKNYKAIMIYDENNKLYYSINDGEINYSNFGNLFTISGVELPDETTAKR